MHFLTNLEYDFHALLVPRVDLVPRVREGDVLGAAAHHEVQGSLHDHGRDVDLILGS